MNTCVSPWKVVWKSTEGLSDSAEEGVAVLDNAVVMVLGPSALRLELHLKSQATLSSFSLNVSSLIGSALDACKFNMGIPSSH